MFIFVFMRILFFTACKICDYVIVPAHDVFIDKQAFHAHRPARVYLAGGNADLRAQAIAETVGKACGCIDHHACAVYKLCKFICFAAVCGQYAVGMPRAMAVDVRYGFIVDATTRTDMM